MEFLSLPGTYGLVEKSDIKHDNVHMNYSEIGLQVLNDKVV